MSNLADLIQRDPQRMKILTSVASLMLPDCYVAAGFVRNCVWDHLHGYSHTPLSDLDVIYFDQEQQYDSMQIQQQLAALQPSVNWQVKNQAIMHKRNGDRPYASSEDAMRHWPEIETAIAVRLTLQGNVEVCAPFGVQSLFSGFISHNPKRSKVAFESRVAAKNWLAIWPKLKVVCA